MIDSLLKRTLQRKPPAGPNLAYFWWRYVGNAKRTLQARLNPASHADASHIAREISEQGIVRGPSDQYLTEEGRAALEEASAMVLDLSRESEVQAAIARGRSDYVKSYVVHLVGWDEEHSADSPIIKLALDKKLLKIIASYFGLWPRLHAVGAWVNFPTEGEATDAQLWHRDPEDVKLIKVFIYLVDVDQNLGPFSYIPKTHPFGAAAKKIPKHALGIRVTDEDMHAAFPRESWVSCTGPAGTMILADTVGYHRGGKPANGNRILITFTYASGMPFKGRRFSVKGSPSWMTEDIQRHAL